MCADSSTGSLGGEPPTSRERLAPPGSRLRELFAIGAMVLVADLTLYRGHGYAGVAIFFLLGPVLLLSAVCEYGWDVIAGL